MRGLSIISLVTGPYDSKDILHPPVTLKWTDVLSTIRVSLARNNFGPLQKGFGLTNENHQENDKNILLSSFLSVGSHLLNHMTHFLLIKRPKITGMGKHLC